MIRLAGIILFFIFLTISTISNSEPIVILEYRGNNYQNDSDNQSNNIFLIDPEHSDNHIVDSGQSLGEIINNFYAGSGLDKRFLKLAIVAANPNAFAQENPNFMFAGAKLHLPSIKQIQDMVIQKYVKHQKV